MGRRRELEHATAVQLAGQLRHAAARSEPFDPDVVFELAHRAEVGERLQAQVRSEALRELAPADGYVDGDF